MIYDGDCDFCKFWIQRWQHTTGDQVDYLPFQDGRIAAQFPELPRDICESAVQLIEPDGAVYSGAEAALRGLAVGHHHHWLLDFYYDWPFVARLTEWCYAFVASHRRFFSVLTRLAWGREVAPPTHQFVRSVFLRALGLIYFAAFVSLGFQIVGLVGVQGVLPAKPTLEGLRQQATVGKVGLNIYHVVPTLCWFGASDNALRFQCVAGTLLAVLVIIGIAPAPCLFLLWAIYLSLATVCREFLGFQWDYLLLEVGWLAIFLAPVQLWPRSSGAAPPSRIVLWLLRWLLFRLMFESGCVKLLSNDVSWRSLTALNFHYETQPLPTWIGWYAHQLPAWVHKSSTVIMFGVELVIPFLIFTPRRPRQFASVVLMAFQIVILLTGNYCFFNLLTITLCLLLFDDVALRKLMPARWRLDSPFMTPSSKRLYWPRQVTVPLLCVTAAISMIQFSGIFKMRVPWPRTLVEVYEWIAPFRSLNTYGLFAVMTTNRPEIIVEGSVDGQTWLPYEFNYKPGDVKRRPAFVAPHQPRLDWQMWFAALGRYEQNPWLLNSCARLLEGSPEVLALLERNPFPQAPPRYIRAVVYDYHFTNFATRRETGAWWRREYKGPYMPVMSLRGAQSP